MHPTVIILNLSISDFFMYQLFCFFKIFYLFSSFLSSIVMACAAENSPEEHNDDFNEERTENSTNQSVLSSHINKKSENCCTNEICSHEILRDGETDSDSKMIQNRMMRKVILDMLLS